jgi:hypothetical protein
MENLKLPAYPLPLANVREGEVTDTGDYCKDNRGFTKLELASLMIAQGIANMWGVRTDTGSDDIIAIVSVRIAKAVLEEANK